MIYNIIVSRLYKHLKLSIFIIQFHYRIPLKKASELSLSKQVFLNKIAGLGFMSKFTGASASSGVNSIEAGKSKPYRKLGPIVSSPALDLKFK